MCIKHIYCYHHSRIILSSCYSGCWAPRLSTLLNKLNSSIHTRLWARSQCLLSIIIIKPIYGRFSSQGWRERCVHVHVGIVLSVHNVTAGPFDILAITSSTLSRVPQYQSNFPRMRTDFSFSRDSARAFSPRRDGSRRDHSNVGIVAHGLLQGAWAETGTCRSWRGTSNCR